MASWVGRAQTTERALSLNSSHHTQRLHSFFSPPTHRFPEMMSREIEFWAVAVAVDYTCGRRTVCSSRRAAAPGHAIGTSCRRRLLYARECPTPRQLEAGIGVRGLGGGRGARAETKRGRGGRDAG